MKSIGLALCLLLFCGITEAKKEGKVRFGVTQWYRFSAASDNKSHHEFKDIQSNVSNNDKMSTNRSCQFFLFFCGLDEKTQDINKICEKAWDNYKPHPDVEGVGYGAAVAVNNQKGEQSLTQLIFIKSLGYGSLKSFKVDLSFDQSGNLNAKDSKIFFRELVGSKTTDDSSYKFLDFENKIAFFELGSKCP